jgi:hypothetical protein
MIMIYATDNALPVIRKRGEQTILGGDIHFLYITQDLMYCSVCMIAWPIECIA